MNIVFMHVAFNLGKDDSCLFITETNIKAFMKFYRESFPAASVLPKMHMLEDHVMSFVRQYRVGLGLMGEQGSMLLSTPSTNLTQTYQKNIPEKVMRHERASSSHGAQFRYSSET